MSIIGEDAMSQRELPWVTELLRDITMDESYTPVWRLAEGYHPSEESVGVVLETLSPIEQKLIYALYRDEIPLEDAYKVLHITPDQVASMLFGILEQLRSPCLLRLALKGREECKKETNKLQIMQTEDILVLGIEVLSIPSGYYNAYMRIGVNTIEELAFFLNNEDEVIVVQGVMPLYMQTKSISYLSACGLWERLKDYVMANAGVWWEELGYQAMLAGRRNVVRGGAGQDSQTVLQSLSLLPGEERDVLRSIYENHASERLTSMLLHMSEERVATIHRNGLTNLGTQMKKLRAMGN